MKSVSHLSRRTEYALLALVTLLGAMLRFHKLSEWSYFVDEYFTWEQLAKYSVPSFFDLLDPNSRHVFWLLTMLSFETFGATVLSSRLFPAIFGVLVIPVVYFPARKIFDQRVALIAAFMLAVSPWHIYNSQIARWYTLLVLCMFLALGAFYEFIESKKIRYLVCYFILFGLGFSLHLTAGFVPMIAGLYVVALLLMPSFRSPTISSKRLLVILGIHIGLALALLPRLISFLQHWRDLEEIFGLWGRDFPLKVAYHMTPSMAIAALAGLVFLLGLRDRRGLFLAIFCTFPTFLLTAGLLIAGINVGTRYVLFCLPAVLIAASYACVCYTERLTCDRKLLALLLVFIIVLPSFQAGYLYFTSAHGYRPRLREAMHFVEKTVTASDRIFCPGLQCKLLAKMEGLNLHERMFLDLESPIKSDPAARTWTVIVGRFEPRAPWEWIAENARLVAEFGAHAGTDDQPVRVFLYTPNGRGRPIEMAPPSS
jgi:mannosyltransferase